MIPIIGLCTLPPLQLIKLKETLLLNNTTFTQLIWVQQPRNKRYMNLESVETIVQRLEMEVKAKEQLKVQVEELQGYIRLLFNPMQQDEGTPNTQRVLSKESIDELERMKSAARVTHKWIDGVFDKGILILDVLVL